MATQMSRMFRSPLRMPQVNNAPQKPLSGTQGSMGGGSQFATTAAMTPADKVAQAQAAQQQAVAQQGAAGMGLGGLQAAQQQAAGAGDMTIGNAAQSTGPKQSSLQTAGQIGGLLGGGAATPALPGYGAPTGGIPGQPGFGAPMPGGVGSGAGSGMMGGMMGGTGNSASPAPAFKKGGAVKGYAKGGSVKSSRGDGIAQRGKTRGTMR